jgi:hypothetical protein
MSNGDEPKRARVKPPAQVPAVPGAKAPEHGPAGERAVGKPSRPGKLAGGPASAFDIWLDRDLHRMFDKVRSEPIPEELLRLIDHDRKKS